MVTKINPTFDITLPRSFGGKSVTELLVDFNVNATAGADVDGAITKTLQTIQNTSTILMVSALTGTGQLMSVFVEGDFPTDTYDGTNSETYPAFLATEIIALGATAGTAANPIDVTGTTVVTVAVFQADQTNT
jgi:hypothetical protein